MDTIAANAYADITEIIANRQSDIRSKYSLAHLIFMNILNERVSDSTLVFSGPYAKLDFLCRKINYAEAGRRHINSFRIRASKIFQEEEEVLQTHWLIDMKALSDFISAAYDHPVPPSLKALLPAVYPQQSYQGIQSDYIRGIVVGWGEYLIVQPVDLDGREVKVSLKTSDASMGDFSYILQLVRVGERVNIVRPTLRDGIYYPELIVYQPDFLVDVSTIAGCFKSYANTALSYLVDLLGPKANSAAILLGNFASQMLDEAIYQGDRPADYTSSVRAFFKQSALSLATCPDPLDNEFHQQARMQQANIRQMVNSKFSEIRDYDAQKVLLEPSFYSELLGLQGRMDLLQDDLRVLIEQKSGKKNYAGGHMENHYVQVLLYRALLHYNFNLPNEHIDAYLLYSKYEDGLMKEGGAPRLLLEAFKIRNNVVSLIMRMAAGELPQILQSLTPESLNEKGLTGKFWENCIRPQLSVALTPLKSASPLVLDYYYRMMAFVAREHLLAKMGNPRNEASGLAALWNSTDEEKRSAGSLLDGMTIDHLEEDDGGGITEATLCIHDYSDNYLPNFRVGDVVVLYSYQEGSHPDATHTLLLRSNVKSLSPEHVTVVFRAPQKNRSVFHLSDKMTRWALEHDTMESSFSTGYRSVASILTASRERADLLLCQREPRVSASAEPIGDYGPFNELISRFVKAKDYFLLIGPPGTGKTSFGMLNMLKEELLAGGSVLLLSYTNRAVDEICSKLLEEGIDYLRLGREMMATGENRPHMIGVRAEGCATLTDVRRMLTDARVVVSTTSSMLGNTDLFVLRDFSLAIIDEASQLLEPHLLGILCARHKEREAVRRFALIGDHKQLPAVVQQNERESEVKESSPKAVGLTNCRCSLFERLLRRNAGRTDVVYEFSRQGRMHHDVALFPSVQFYQGHLREVPLPHQTGPLAYAKGDKDTDLKKMLSTHRLMFLAVHNVAVIGAEKANAREADMIARLVMDVYRLYQDNGKTFSASQTIGVIVPYRHQIAAVKARLKKNGIPDLLDIVIDTVERFQGSQRDVIIYGFTVQRSVQLRFLTSNMMTDHGVEVDRKLNVALTRAKEQTIMVGNPQLLSEVPLFAQLIDYVKASGGYYEADSE